MGSDPDQSNNLNMVDVDDISVSPDSPRYFEGVTVQ